MTLFAAPVTSHNKIVSDSLIHVRENPAHSFYFPVLIYTYCLHRGQEVF